MTTPKGGQDNLWTTAETYDSYNFDLGLPVLWEDKEEPKEVPQPQKEKPAPVVQQEKPKQEVTAQTVQPVVQPLPPVQQAQPVQPVQPTPPDQAKAVQHTFICNKCEESTRSADLHQCGECKRCFHPWCATFIATPKGNGKQCSNCASGTHNCFGCGKQGKVGKDLHKCATEDCTRFYHMSCCLSMEWTKLTEGNAENTNHTPFSCPLHTCSVCHGLEDTTKQHLNKCNMCPTAYHHKCLPAGTVRLSKMMVMCPKHALEVYGPQAKLVTPAPLKSSGAFTDVTKSGTLSKSSSKVPIKQTPSPIAIPEDSSPQIKSASPYAPNTPTNFTPTPISPVATTPTSSTSSASTSPNPPPWAYPAPNAYGQQYPLPVLHPTSYLPTPPVPYAGSAPYQAPYAPVPNYLPTSTAVPLQPTSKKSICFPFMNTGKCQYGANCYHSHEPTDEMLQKMNVTANFVAKKGPYFEDYLTSRMEANLPFIKETHHFHGTYKGILAQKQDQFIKSGGNIESIATDDTDESIYTSETHRKMDRLLKKFKADEKKLVEKFEQTKQEIETSANRLNQNSVGNLQMALNATKESMRKIFRDEYTKKNVDEFALSQTDAQQKSYGDVLDECANHALDFYKELNQHEMEGKTVHLQNKLELDQFSLLLKKCNDIKQIKSNCDQDEWNMFCSLQKLNASLGQLDWMEPLQEEKAKRDKQEAKEKEERDKKEKIERDKAAKEKAEKERIEKERLEKEEIEKMDRERERERQEREKEREKEREIERKRDREHARLEREREWEREQRDLRERDRERERERERIEHERMARERERRRMSRSRSPVGRERRRSRSPGPPGHRIRYRSISRSPRRGSRRSRSPDRTDRNRSRSRTRSNSPILRDGPFGARQPPLTAGVKRERGEPPTEDASRGKRPAWSPAISPSPSPSPSPSVQSPAITPAVPSPAPNEPGTSSIQKVSCWFGGRVVP